MTQFQTLYDKLGGEVAVRAVVEAFYDLVEHDPAYEPLHRLHLRGHGVAHSREEQFGFLSGFLGGPRLYVERHGHSNVRDIHAHVAVDEGLRDLWLACMRQALVKADVRADLSATLMVHFNRAAEVVRNR